MESLINPYSPAIASTDAEGAHMRVPAALTRLWRSHTCPADCQRPTLALSWTLALVLSCLGVSVLGLARPVSEPIALLDRAAAPEGQNSGELAFLEMAAPSAAEEQQASPTDTPVVLELPLPELSALQTMPMEADLPSMDLAEVLTAEDVFEVPPAAPIEDPLQTETPSPTRERQVSPSRSSSSPSTTTSRSPSSSSSSGAASSMASRGGAGGTGTGSGGGSQGYFPSPPYPAVARSRGMQGTVYLSITFGSDGRVTSATVARSSGYSELDRAAADWVRRRWRGSSSQVGTYRQPVNFRLR